MCGGGGEFAGEEVAVLAHAFCEDAQRGFLGSRERADEEQAAGTHCEEWLQEVGREGRGEFECEEAERQGRGGGDFAEGGEIASGGDGDEQAFGRSVLEFW